MPDETKGPDPVKPESPDPGKPVPETPANANNASPAGTPAAAGGATKPAIPPIPGQASDPKPTPPTGPTNPAVTGEKPAAKAPIPPPSAEPGAPKATPPASATPPKPPAPSAPAKPAGPTPQPWESDLVTNLKERYGSGLREASTYLGQKYLIVDSSILYEVLGIMCAEQQFDYCVDITAVHYPKREQPFDIVYILYSFSSNERVRVKALLKDGEPVRSVVDLWATANWLERECFDMFGIKFEGHPDLRRILLPDGWKGYPLRKEYPITLQDQEWVQINLGIESGQ